DPGDQKIIAVEAPRGNFGITGNVGWKNLSLSVFFQGLMQHEFWPPNGNWNAFYPYNAMQAMWSGSISQIPGAKRTRMLILLLLISPPIPSKILSPKAGTCNREVISA